MEGKPYLKNLEEFSKAVLEDLWESVKQFANVSSSTAVSLPRCQNKHNVPFFVFVVVFLYTHQTWQRFLYFRGLPSYAGMPTWPDFRGPFIDACRFSILNLAC